MIINLLLNSAGELCDQKEGIKLFHQLFKLIDMNKSDEELQENILWLVNSMVESAESQSVVEVCSKNGIV